MMNEAEKIIKAMDDIMDFCKEKVIENGFDYIDEEETLLYAKMMKMMTESKKMILEQARLLDKIDEIDKKLDRLLSKQ